MGAESPSRKTAKFDDFQMPVQLISLQKLAVINEDVKVVAQLARSIGLGALNAGLISNKCDAGSGSRGYGVAAVELRRFSAKLEGLLLTMAGEVFRQVGAAAALLNLFRRRNALCTVQSGSGRIALSSVVSGMDAEIARQLYLQGEWRKKFLLQLRRAEQISREGHITGRLARLEAVGGGSLAVSMSMAASGIEEQVLCVLEIVSRIVQQVV